MELLDYLFFRNALIGTLLACIACGIAGTYIVSRRLLFISGGITHASFGGVGLGMYFSFSPTLGAFIFAVASALGIQLMGRNREIREDSAIALLWVLGMTIGVIFCFLSPGYSSELSTYLFGNILTITNSDIAILAAIATLLITFTLLMHRSIVAVAFDKTFARSRHIPAEVIETLMMVFTSLAIVASLRIAGIILVISILAIPQMTAMLFTSSYRKIIILSIVIGYIASCAGVLLSLKMEIPGGASVILCSLTIYAASAAFKRAVKSRKAQ